MSSLRFRFQQWLYRTGSEPKKSARRFFIGLALFAFSVVTIFYGREYMVFYILGMLSLVSALVLAAWGYLGIFANRFSQVVNRAAAHRGEDD